MEYVVARSRRTRYPHQLINAGGDVPLTTTTTHHHLHLPPPTPSPDHDPPLKAQSTTQQQQQQQRRRRMDLEHEVADLKKQLRDEETVQQVLQRALQHQQHTTTVSPLLLNLNDVPAFVPPKTKELLAEIVLVEQEIARLETQIHTMKGALITSSSTANAPAPQLQPTTAYSSYSYSPPATNHTTGILPNSNGAAGATITTNGTTAAALRQTQPSPAHAHQVVAPDRDRDREIKSMFFISQAMTMNGGYLKRHHLTIDDDKAKSPKETTRSAAMSPKLDTTNNIYAHQYPPRNSLEQQKPPPPAKQAQSEQMIKIIHPNKLSERILKCLVCIFIRQLRSSRAAELEKSGNLARSGNLMQMQQHHGHGGGSFRIDAGLLINAAREKEKKERGRQQDHYGIFAITDSIVRDIGPYKNLVRFTSNSFDLRGFSASPLLPKLREMMEALQQVDLRSLTHQQKLAFWLNIYNTCIMHGILQQGLPTSSQKLLALKNKASINVSGDRLNALVIENFILRQPSSVREELWRCDVDVEEQQVRGAYGLQSSEPNIVFALCCGTRSSPSLRVYKAERVMAELEKAKLEYLQASLVVTAASSTAGRRVVMIPGLMEWSMHDFGAKDTESLVRWICDQLPTSWSLRKSMVDCLRSSSATAAALAAVGDGGVVDVIPYDYEFQYLLPSM